MEFRCEGLPNAGVDLDPTRAIGKEDPFAAILLNRSAKPIAASSFIWSYEELDGRRYTSSITRGCGMTPSLLPPFGMTPKMRTFAGYWHVILPGSKRYVSGFRMFGDKSDVRSPEPEEQWDGGVVSAEPGRDDRPMDRMRSVTLTLDGVFFADGEFAGPNQAQLYERIVCDAETYQDASRMARERFESGAGARDILDAVERIIGPAQHRPPPPPPPGQKMDIEELRLRARADLAWKIAMSRPIDGDGKTASTIVGWADAVAPRFRRQ